MNARMRSIAFRLKVLSDKKEGYNKCISFESLGVKFQDSDVMSLRARGICVLSVDASGQPGVGLALQYRCMDKNDYCEAIRQMI